MADPNTRQGKRTPVTLKIKFKSETLEQFIERYAVDVSQGGIFIRTKEPLAVGTQMRFEFQLRDASPLIGGEGTVVWTRENDPSRPAIAPGMGVRFDRLADGSQVVLERILAEKAKQAPQRPPADTAKPPLFTDTPTRVAPAPIQDKLLGDEAKAPRGRPTGEPFNDQHTPLPKPMPFHSDADEFPDEAFEEATKVRALDELVAQTAVDPGASNDLLLPPDELAARRGNAVGVAVNPAIGNVPGRGDATLNEEGTEETIPPLGPDGGKASSTALGMKAASFSDRDSAPGLPSPPHPGGHPLGHSGVVPPKPPPRMLDTSPSPRTESTDPMERLAKTRLGMEPVAATTRPGPSAPPPMSPPMGPPMGGPMMSAPTMMGTPAAHSPVSAPPLVSPGAETRPSGMRAVAAEPTAPTRVPAAPGKKSIAPIIILILVLLAGGSAGVWFFVLRDKAVEEAGSGTPGPGTNGSAGPGSQLVADKGSDKGSNDVGSAKINTGGSGSGAETPAPKAPLVDLEIAVPAGIEKAEVAVDGTDQKGPAPFKAKLEKDKAYKVRVSAPHMKTLVLDVKGGQTDKPVAKLEPKPHSINFTSQPPGALIYIDGAATDKVTPFKLELTKAQAAKKTVRAGLRKAGFKPAEKMVGSDQYVEDADEEVATVDEKLVVQPVVVQQPPPPNRGSGGTGSNGSASTNNGGSGGSGETPTPPTGGSDTPTPGSASKPPDSGSAKTPPPAGSGSEPEPDFLKR